MQKNKLVHIFYNLSPHEKIAFRKWVYSPYFNKQEPIKKLLDHLYYLDLEKDRCFLDRNYIFTLLYGQIPFSMPKLRHLFSELTQLLEQFLVYQYRKTQEFNFHLDLSQVYKQRGFEQLQNQSLQKAQKIQAKYPFQDIIELEQKYQLEWATYDKNLSKNRSIHNNLQSLNSSFDLVYIAGKLKHSCRILSYQGMYTQQYQMGLLPQLLDYLEQEPQHLLQPTIGLYYYYYKASTSKEKESNYFKKFKDYLFDYQHFLPKNEVRDLYILATNYSIKRLNTDLHDYYIQETFELYQEALKQGILIENEQISPFAFTNIVAVTLGLKKYDWTWQFIQQYSPFLAPKTRQAYVDYNLSRWYFQQQQYQKAEKLLVADDFEDLHLNLSAKMLLLKIYYELRELQLLDALLNRFRTYLSRQKGLVYHKKNYNNIIRFTQRLVNINPYSDKAKNKLQKEINAEELLTEKKWLLEQLEGL